MPWMEVDIVGLREEFVVLSLSPGANVRELCRRFGISAKTGYKWRKRYLAEGRAGLSDRSRCPRHSPRRAPPETEKSVAALRATHPAWGGRKIRARLLALGREEVPAASTITGILRRRGLVEAAESAKRGPWRRFERPRPNDLWQMDFKGHFALTGGGRCHPLTVLDDHSRFALGLEACADERTETVRGHLRALFRRYGLPERILADNGSPWGSDPSHPYTSLTVWLLRLGVGVSHGRPYHPQTQGKDERFHRTVGAEDRGAQAHLLEHLAALDGRPSRRGDPFAQSGEAFA